MPRERLLFFLWAPFACLGMLAVGSGRGNSSNPAKGAVENTGRSAAKECYFVRSTVIRFQAGREPYFVEWDLCREEAPQNYVTVEKTPSEPLYAFDGADIVDRLDRVDFDNDGNEELLFVGMGGGTGHDIDWCALGFVAGRLRCWQVPDLDAPSEKLLKPDEDFCCKDWTLKVTNEGIVLGRGIYHTGPDGNCCPSRGGAFVELTPDHGRFHLQKAWRSDLKTYNDWLFAR